MKRVRFLVAGLSLFISALSILAGDLATTPDSAIPATVDSVLPAEVNALTDCPGTNVVRVGTEAALRTAMAKGGLVTLCFNGTITLSNSIAVAKNVTLYGGGHQVVISGGQKVRLFSVSPGIRFTATNLTLADGWRVGTNGQIGQTVRGGAIYNDGGIVRLVGCTLTNNQARGGGGTGGYTGNGGHGEGGAIYNRNGGSVILEDCQVFNNQAFGGSTFSGKSGVGTGGALYSLGGTTLFRNTLFASNTCLAALTVMSSSFAQGGACYLSNATCMVESSTFLGNTAEGMDVTNYVVQSGSPLGARGGALYLHGGITVLSNVQVLANSAFGGTHRYGTAFGEGGGIYCNGELWLRSCQLRGNRANAGQGGGLYNASRTVGLGCTWEENSVTGEFASVHGMCSTGPGGSAYGGAVCNSGLLALTNCTVTLNVAQGGGQSSFVPLECRYRSGHGFGGGIFNHTNATAHLHHVTLATNWALIGPNPGTNEAYGVALALGANLANSNGVVYVRSSILAGEGEAGNGYGPLTDLGYNVSSDGSCAFNSGTSLNVTDPLLHPLADNGGPTPTLALKPTSPAIDIVPTNSAPATDQRGVDRPVGAVADAGAFEGSLSEQVYPLATSVTGQGTITLNPPGGSYPSNLVVNLTATPAPHWVFLHWGGDAQGTNTPLSLAMNSEKSVTAHFVEPAWITAGPTNLTTSLGGSATFGVAASGTPPLTYAWALNGTPLAGATNPVLSLTNVQWIQEGSYTVVVNNPYGRATSQPAELALDTPYPGTNVVSARTEAALRAALARGGVVTFRYNGTITLTNPIAITQDVTLDATDHYVVISGGQKVGLFSVAPGVHFTATNLILADGCRIGTNGQPGQTVRGGAIYNEGGFVRLVGCTLTNNQARGGDGTGGYTGNGGHGEGGAIYNRNGGSVILEDCQVLNNQAFGGSTFWGKSGVGIGGALYSLGGTTLFRNTLFASNSCLTPVNGGFAQGGACYLSNVMCTIESSTFLSNVAEGKSSYPGQGSPVSARGGALYLQGGSTVLSNVQVMTNSALGGGSKYGSALGEGGGIYCDGELWLRSCQLRGNRANGGQGGGLLNASRTVALSCTWEANYVNGQSSGSSGSGIPWTCATGPGGTAYGGAICNNGLLALTNCTVALNVAQGGVQVSMFPELCGQRSGHGFGGGIYNGTNATAHLHHVTLASNWALIGSNPGTNHAELALGANLANSNGVVYVRSSILAGDSEAGNGYGPLTDLGYNVSSDGSCAFNSGLSLNFTDPLLLPLADNGGPTPTLALRPNSPAIDIVPANSAPATDQRGVARPLGAAADAGAFEGSVTIPELVIQGGGPAIQVRFSATGNTRYLLQSSTDLVQWATLETINSSASEGMVLRSFNPAGSGQRFFRLIQE